MKTVDYKEFLFKRLRNNPEYCKAYLNEALHDEDFSVFLLALKDVIEAKSSIAKISDEAGLNRENLYRMLSETGNPQLQSILKLIDALGLKLSIS